MSGTMYFILCVALLIGGYFVYGSLVERIFRADSSRITPVKRQQDGVDFIEMPVWKLYMGQMINISGLGPVLGTILGALYADESFHRQNDRSFPKEKDRPNSLSRATVPGRSPLSYTNVTGEKPHRISFSESFLHPGPRAYSKRLPCRLRKDAYAFCFYRSLYSISGVVPPFPGRRPVVASNKLTVISRSAFSGATTSGEQNTI